MNYRHAFHAGNHADVLNHVVLLAVCDRLGAKPAACFALDTHAGRGLYALDAEAATRTGEADEGIGALLARPPAQAGIARYLDAVRACRSQHGEHAYPGSPWLLAHALRDIDRIACCELHPDEAAVLKATFSGDRRVAVHARDGYPAMKALLPPYIGTHVALCWSIRHTMPRAPSSTLPWRRGATDSRAGRRRPTRCGIRSNSVEPCTPSGAMPPNSRRSRR